MLPFYHLSTNHIYYNLMLWVPEALDKCAAEFILTN